MCFAPENVGDCLAGLKLVTRLVNGGDKCHNSLRYLVRNVPTPNLYLSLKVRRAKHCGRVSGILVREEMQFIADDTIPHQKLQRVAARDIHQEGLQRHP